MNRGALVSAALVVVAVACSQPTADDLPAGSVALVPAVPADSLAVEDGAQFVRVTPRTPIGRIVDDAIRGARAAEIVAGLGGASPASYLPACTGGGDVIVVVPADVDVAEARQVLFDVVRGLDFVDITEPEVVPVRDVGDLTCAAEGRPLP
jgi:hypothetical protein